MTTLDKAKKIAQEQFPDYPICSIRDIGEKWAFMFDTPINTTPVIYVEKANGTIGKLTISYNARELALVDINKIILDGPNEEADKKLQIKLIELGVTDEDIEVVGDDI